MSATAKTAREVFVAAVKLAPEQWDAYLTDHCDDDDLRRRVRILLSAHAEAGSFLQSPAAPEANMTVDAPIGERPGTVIGPYKLLEQIGEGGFGVVFMAEQTEPMRRKIALKVIKPGMDTKQVIARFEAERQALALMDHPNIARVLDAGATDSGRPYFVMELIRGIPITEYCDKSQLTPRTRLELFLSVCQAVQHAHQKGVIHRDIKPSNVLVTLHDGTPVVKIIDFGIAKAMGQQLTDKTLFTNFAHMIGTPLYMSPEQTEMSSLDIDTRSDIYSLGVLLYELLTGSTPFDRERLKGAAFDEIRRLIREVEPPKPSTRIHTLGDTSATVSANRKSDPGKLSRLFRGDLDWIVMKCLEKDRQRRYETTSGLARDIERYLRDDPVEACPPSLGYRFRKYARRNKVLLTATAAVAVALLLGTTISIWQAFRATEAEDWAEKGWDAEKVERQRAVTAERQAKERLFEAKVAQADASQWSGRPGQRFASLAALAEAAQLIPALDLGPAAVLDLRNRAMVSLTRADLRPSPALRLNEIAGPSELAGSLQRYVRQVSPNVLAIHSRDDQRELLRLSISSGRLQDLRFSSCGRYLAYTCVPAKIPKSVWVWDLKDAKQDAKPLFRAARACSVDICPAAKRAAVTLLDGSLIVYQLPEGKELKRFPADLGAESRVRFQPGGSRVVVKTGKPPEARVIDLESGQTVDRVAPPGLNFCVVDQARGNLIALACGSRIALWQPTTGKELSFLDGHEGSVTSVAFAHRGSVLASAGSDSTIRLWDVATGKQLVSFPARGSNLRLSPDDLLLTYTGRSNKTAYLQVATGTECSLLRGHAGSAVRGMDCHPEGRWLASAADDGIRICDLESGKEVAFQKGHGALPIAFDPADGNLVAPIRMSRMVRRLAVREDAAGVEGGRLEPVRIEPQAYDFRPLGQFSLWDPPNDHFHAAISADGRWLVKGYDEGFSHNTFKGKRSAPQIPPVFMMPKLFDRRAGTTQSLGGQFVPAQVALSPDARQVVVATHESYRVFQVEPLTSRGVLQRLEAGADPAPVAFSPEGRMLAIAESMWEVKLIDSETLEELVRLPAPERSLITRLCFSPDGSRLAAGTRAGLIQVWDVRRIRRQLAEIGLDWKLKPWEPAAGK